MTAMIPAVSMPPFPVLAHADHSDTPQSADSQPNSPPAEIPEAAPPSDDQPALVNIEIQDLDDLEFLLNEIEDQIAPLA